MQLSFSPYRLDLDSERIWRNGEELHLRRKPFAILRHLVRNPQRLVTHEEIVEAVWGKIAMSESLLRTHVRDLRQVLGEGVVETVVGRGYRFVPELQDMEFEASPSDAATAATSRVLVGRDAELDALRATLRSAKERRRTTVFVTGEAGTGKTTLVDAFLEQASASGPVLIGRGACVEQYGSGQAYLPVLDAIDSLCRGRGAERALDVFAACAPTWLVQMPALIRPDRLGDLQRRAAGATQARTVRELSEALETLSTHAPVAIVFDDLQWTDASTAELLAFLSNRRESARLLMLATYRPEEVPRGHPLTRVASELIAHRKASSVALDALNGEAVDAYLAKRYPGHTFPPELSLTLRRSTGGNPLFLTTLVDELEAQGLIRGSQGAWELSTTVEDVAARRPDSIRRLLDTQIDRLSPAEQRIIEVAAIAGMSFTPAVVAHALDADADSVDSTCESLASERRLLGYVGTETWPDGTIQSRYVFGHALFQHAALARSTAATVRVRRRKIAERLEAGYQGQEGEVAAELAIHFEHAQVPSKAARWHVVAGDRAGRLYGLKEAIAHFESARTLLEGLPAGRERDSTEMRASLGLAWHRFQADGAAEDAIPMLHHVRELALRLDDKTSLADALARLEGMQMVRGELRAVAELSSELAPILAYASDPFMPRLARQVEAAAVLLRGDFEKARLLLDDLGMLRVEDVEAKDVYLLGRAMGFFLSWLTGRPDYALALAESAERLAERLGNPYEHGAMLAEKSLLHVLRREPAKAAEVAGRALVIFEQGAFGIWEDRAQTVLRWAQTELEQGTQQPADELLSTALDLSSVGRTMRALLYVSMCTRLGRREKALEMIATALDLVDRCDERWLEAEFHRMRGELLLASDPIQAERSTATAIEIARQQGSKLLELRATVSMHGLAAGEKKKLARENVARLLAVITEGHDTSDLVEAQAIV